MEMTITSAAIATLLSATTSSFITLWITRTNKTQAIEKQLDAILKIAIDHPYLESEAFTATWTNDFNRNDDKYLRYDVYCTLLFNYLSRVADHYNYNKKKIENYLAIKDWVKLHGEYWIHPPSTYENIDSYDKRFVNLINSYLI